MAGGMERRGEQLAGELLGPNASGSREFLGQRRECILDRFEDLRRYVWSPSKLVAQAHLNPRGHANAEGFADALVPPKRGPSSFHESGAGIVSAP